jgi:hypothetical protein
MIFKEKQKKMDNLMNGFLGDYFDLNNKKNKAPLDKTWLDQGYSQEEYDDMYNTAEEIMSDAMDKLCTRLALTLSTEEQRSMVHTILDEIVFSNRTDFLQ